jgi:hypothetical protein
MVRILSISCNPSSDISHLTAFNVNALILPLSTRLTHLNSQYSSLADGSRDACFFDDPSFREATRLIELKLHLIPVESMRVHAPPDVSFAPSSNQNYPYPPLFFSGRSRGVHGNEAVVEGLVRMGWDGVVRWQFVCGFSLFTFGFGADWELVKASIYGGHTQWRFASVPHVLLVGLG